MAPPKQNKKPGGLLGSLLGKEATGSQVVARAAAPAAPAAAPAKPKAPAPAPQPAAQAPRPQQPAAQAMQQQPTSPTAGARPAAPAARPAAPRPAAAAPATPKAQIAPEDARAAWQPRPRIPVRLLDNYINFMVIGDSGLGKTTFIKNLVASYNTKTPLPADGTTTTLSAFQLDPAALRTELEPMEIVEAGRRLHISVQDMPGYGDDINLVRYLRVVLAFILEQRAKDYELLAGGRALNETAMCGQLQHSITACVYFLAPHRVKKVDVILMSALSQLVTVIPVIGKSDSMTADELAAYRAEVRSMLAAPSKFAPSRSLAPLGFSAFAWDPEVMAQLGLAPEGLPLALVTSNVGEPVKDAALLQDLGLDPAATPEQPVRRYKWGTAYGLQRTHSDLVLLKRLLLGDRVDSLYAMLDESYGRYVAFCEQYEESGKQLPMLVQAAASLSCPYLEYDDYTKAQAALDAAQQAMATLMAENRALLDKVAALEKVATRAANPPGSLNRPVSN